MRRNFLIRWLDNESVVDSINRRIKILSCIIEKEEGIDQYVNYAKDHPLTQQQLQNLTQQCMILRACYYCALRDMPIVQNWSTIISLALKGMSELGVKEIKSEQTIMKYHKWFREHDSFLHPNHYVQM